MPFEPATRIVPASPTSSASTVTAAADVAGGAADGGAWVATGGTVAATVGFVVEPGVQAAATTSTDRRPMIELVRLMLGLPRAGKDPSSGSHSPVRHERGVGSRRTTAAGASAGG